LISPSGRSAAIRRLRVLFVNRYYAPDVSATSQMLTDLAEGLVRSGFEVSVVCSRQLYENPRSGLVPYEVIGGVSVWRVGGARFGRANLGGRALDYASFWIGATRALLRRACDCDVLVLKTDPPLLSLIGWFVARRRHVACVNWLQDIFPEVATRLGLSPLPRSLEALLRNLRDRSLAAAYTNVVVGSRMREYLIGRGVPAARVSIGENWADESTVRMVPTGQSALRRKLSLTECFVVAYSGNLGRAHDAETLLAAVQILRGDPTTAFLMIGGGINMRGFEARARAQALTHVLFVPYQPRVAVSDSLAAADVHIVTLLPQLEGLVVPSKLYGILAAGRPVVFVGDSDGELARLVRENQVGLSVASGDGPGLAGALRTLRDFPAQRARMGERARALFEERYTLHRALSRWQALLAHAASGG
jgi:colanic acid biosynthesis glycosyl transferase WcaI